MKTITVAFRIYFVAAFLLTSLAFATSRDGCEKTLILRDLDTVWDLKKFEEIRQPLVIGTVVDPKRFSESNQIRVLDMPIKMAGSIDDYRIPTELAQFKQVIQQIIDHEHSIMTPEQLKKYYAYITVDQLHVPAGTTQRKAGAHVDGFQGARINPKNEINHSYIVADAVPTVFYPQAFNFSGLDESVDNFFHAMDQQANEAAALYGTPYEIYLIDAYSVHRADTARNDTNRTFLRLSYDVKIFDRLGNTHNPMFDYSWEMQARDIHSILKSSAGAPRR